MKYAAKGAQRVQRADQNVRQSIQTTADTARESRGEINRWMQRHQAAILGIAAATTGAMAAIISQSPALSAQLSEVRLAFSLLAMELGRELAPTFDTIGEKAVGFANWFKGLPDPVQSVIAHAIALTGVLAGLAVGFSAIAPTVTTVLGLLSGPLVLAIGAVIGIAAALYTAWQQDFAGIRGVVARFVSAAAGLFGGFVDFVGGLWNAWGDEIMAVTRFIGKTIGVMLVSTIDALATAMQMAGAILRGDFNGALESLLGLADRGNKRFRNLHPAIGKFQDGIRNTVSDVQDFAGAVGNVDDTLRSAFEDTAEKALKWGKDIVDNLIRGIQQKTPGLDDVVQGAKSAIAKHLSFDQVANDRMARRWGRDMVQEFSAGMQSARPTLETGAPDVGQTTGLAAGGGGGGGGGTTNDITFERGAIVIHGSGGDGRVTSDDVAEGVSKAFDGRTSGRGRL